jgi:hypothetical protein
MASKTDRWPMHNPMLDVGQTGIPPGRPALSFHKIIHCLIKILDCRFWPGLPAHVRVLTVT